MNINKSRPCHPTNYKKGRQSKVKYLVMHYVGALGSAANNAAYYGNTANIGASAHYFVGHAAEMAEIWQSVAEEDTAYHCGTTGTYRHPKCRNANSIGIEMCCHQDNNGKWYFDPMTVRQAAELARDICNRYGIDRAHVVRHYDVTGKICPAPYVNDEKAWQNFLDMVFPVTMPSDTADSWAQEAWVKAYRKGILDGTRPKDSITRQEMAVVLDRLGLLE